MHQRPRPAPISASPARSFQTNPNRTNNAREGGTAISPSSPRQPSGSSEPGVSRQRTDPQDAEKSMHAKVAQVIQRFFLKVVLVILSARVDLPLSATGTDKWYGLVLPESDSLRDHLRPWRNAELLDNKIVPLVLDIYIDDSDLASNERLVIKDYNGRKQNVTEQLKEAQGRNYTPKIILERWIIQLYSDDGSTLDDTTNADLALTYKHAVIIMRSLYTMVALYPAYQLLKKLLRATRHDRPIRPKFRMTPGTPRSMTTYPTELSTPLCDFDEPCLVQDNSFARVETPFGELAVTVTYRQNCDFRIERLEPADDIHLVNLDDEIFQPSLVSTSPTEEVGSLNVVSGLGSRYQNIPGRATRPDLVQIAAQTQAYGSLSTYHNLDANLGTSPLTALRAARDLYYKANPETPPAATDQFSSHSSTARPSPGTPGRRPSVTFQAFKSRPLSDTYEQPPLSPRTGQRPGSGGSTQSSRIPSGADTSTSVPNRPTVPRYSSSFSHRRSRASLGSAAARTEEEGGPDSSGRNSISSANQQTSLTLAEGQASGGSSQMEDDENISDFLKMLDQKSNLKSFQPFENTKDAEASARRTSAALNRFAKMKQSNIVLSDSMSSSLHRSPSTSSRQLGAVPAMVSGTSISSSPGDRVSPRTPHTPAIPSRLSANSIIEYNSRERGTYRRHRFSNPTEDARLVTPGSREEQTVFAIETGLSDDNENENPSPSVQTGATPLPGPESAAGAIDIPSSSRPFRHVFPRSTSHNVQKAQPASSAAPGLGIGRARDERHESQDEYAVRAASVGARRPKSAADRLMGTRGPVQPMTRLDIPSELERERRTETAEQVLEESEVQDSPLPIEAEVTEERPKTGTVHSSNATTLKPSRFTTSFRGSDRGYMPSSSSSHVGASTSAMGGSGTGSGSGSGSDGLGSGLAQSDVRGEDEEPLLFAMSELGGTGDAGSGSGRGTRNLRGVGRGWGGE